MLYSYTAKDPQGETVKSEIESVDQTKAIRALKERKLIVLAIREKKETSFSNILKFGVPLKDRIFFIQQLTLMLKSGVPLVEALEALREQATNPQLSKIVAEMSAEIRGGKSLSQSLNRYPKVFLPLMVSVTQSGEKSGKLDNVLSRLGLQMQKDYDLYSKVRSAMIYPAVILLGIAGVLALVVIFIMPQIKEIFQEMNVPLPLMTRIILAVSSFLAQWWWLFLIFIIGLIIILRWLITIESIRIVLDKLILKIPLIGSFSQKIYMARLSRNLATLVSAGLPMLESLETTKGVVNNIVYKNALDRISKEVENGIPLSQAIKKEKDFPLLVSNLINIGEKSGKLDFVLTSLADFFDKEVEATTRNLSSLLEPILTILLGIGVALVVASVIIPIYSLVNTI